MQRPRSTVELWPRHGHDRDSITAGHTHFQLTLLQIRIDTRQSSQFLPSSHFGHGILTWHLPMLFRTPPGYNLLVRGPANHPKDAIAALEGIVETDSSTSGFSINWKFTREFMPVRFDVDEPICMIVPQRRGELEEFAPELMPIESNDELHRKHEFFLGTRGALGREPQEAEDAGNERASRQGDYTRGRHSDGKAGAKDHQTRRHLRSFVQHQPQSHAR